MNFPASFPELATPRLALRRLAAEDADALFTIHSDAQAMRFWSGAPWNDRAQAEGLIARAHATFESRTQIRWGIAPAAGGPLLGTCTLFSFDAQNRRAELGYILGRDHWGRGYAHEALSAVLDWAFGPLGLHRVEADTDPRNAGSVRALERLGFVREGLLRERWRVGDEISDTAFFGLLAREWLARRAVLTPPSPRG
jgi:RimJ/RimL family protein N-acetyltransferase